jgi:hypothetical protein
VCVSHTGLFLVCRGRKEVEAGDDHTPQPGAWVIIKSPTTRNEPKFRWNPEQMFSSSKQLSKTRRRRIVSCRRTNVNGSLQYRLAAALSRHRFQMGRAKLGLEWK